MAAVLQEAGKCGERARLTNDQIITVITSIRARNNRNWMKLLRLALKAEPAKSKMILMRIAKNDREITRWTEQLG